jgi:hypothetical protein
MSLRDKVQAILSGGEPSAAAARTRYRDAAMNWIAVGVMLSAWHMEARLERMPGAPRNAHVAKAAAGRDTPLWDAASRKPSWISRAISGAPLIGVQHVVPPSSVYTPVSTLRLVRRWLPGI